MWILILGRQLSPICLTIAHLFWLKMQWMLILSLSTPYIFHYVYPFKYSIFIPCQLGQFSSFCYPYQWQPHFLHICLLLSFNLLFSIAVVLICSYVVARPFSLLTFYVLVSYSPPSWNDGASCTWTYWNWTTIGTQPKHFNNERDNIWFECHKCINSLAC